MGLLNRIEELEKELLELKELVKEEQGFPQLGDEYWYITDGGDVDSFGWENSQFDVSAQAIGNVYKTEQEAEFALEKLKVENELRRLSDSWDLELTQYSFSFDWECGELKVEYPDYNQYPNSYYFYSADDLQQAIETVGRERIKKYLFGVED
jgi:hypothetical protein